MSKKYSFPRIIAEYGNIVIVDYNNSFLEEPLHSELLKAQKQYIVTCARLCGGTLVGSSTTILTYSFSNDEKANVFKSLFVRA